MPLIRPIPLAGFAAGFILAATAAFAGSQRYESVVFDQVTVKADIDFRTAPNIKREAETLKLDLYQPAGDTERNRPAIIWIHGGGFRTIDDKRQAYIIRMSTEFAKRGYVCVAPNYRVREDPSTDRLGTLKEAVEDCRAAFAWVKAHATELGVDPQRIAVGGGSAGGQVAVSLVALENIDAAKTHSPPIFAFVNLWGSPRADLILANVDKHYPPTVIVHGTADQSVPFAQSEALIALLKAAGVKNELLPMPGRPHGPWEDLAPAINAASAFVFAALKK